MEENKQINSCCTNCEKNSDKPKVNEGKKHIILFIAGALFFVSALLINFKQLKLPLYIIAYLIVGGSVILEAFKNILKGKVFDENFLMGIATIGAFLIGEYPEGVAVMLFYRAGMFFEDMAVGHSRKSIAALMNIKPDYANLLAGDETKRVDPTTVHINELILVKPGEKIPLDGIVTNGTSTVDTSALTGESIPKDISQGDSVISGCINLSGVLTIRVTAEFGESTVAKILKLVETAGSRKSKTENFITIFAKYYTPFVVLSATAIAIIPPLALNQGFTDWFYRSLIFLVVSCPCALVISIPLGFFGGIGGASKNGVLIKGGNYLEALSSVDTVVFDKTGTLTKGKFEVTKVFCNPLFSKKSLIEYAAYAESFSGHPIAKSILHTYNNPVDKNKISDYKEISGCGISAKVGDDLVLAGNLKLMEKGNIKIPEYSDIGTKVYIAVNGNFAGCIIISDIVKKDSKSTISSLKSMGNKTVMLTGDTKSVAQSVADDLGIDEVYSELLPHQKVEVLEKLYSEKTPKGKLIFVGDGINDAPVLARADVGIAMGGLGSDAAIEAADVVLMTDEPSKLVTAIKISKYTKKIVWQNIAFAMGIKAAVLILGTFGFANMWEAVFADVGVTIIAVFNSTRVLKFKS